MKPEEKAIPINFSQGLDTKTDPWQIPLGKFQVLNNQVFDKGGRLTKRNGFGNLSSFPSATYLTTFNGNLTGIGNSVYALNEASNSIVSKGSIQPMQVGTLPLIRNNINQTQSDTAVSTNGLVCTVYSEINNGITDYRYAIADVNTGQNIVAPSAIPVASGVVAGAPRVFVLGNYFVIVFTNVISTVTHLQYVSVSIANPTVVTGNQDIAGSATISPMWDGAVFGKNLFIAYNTTSGGQSVKVTSLSSYIAATGGTPAAEKTFSSSKATHMTVTVDGSVASNPIVWVNFYRSDTSAGSVLALDQNLNTVLAVTATISSETAVNLASAAQNGVCTIFYEISNYYSYDSSVPSNYVKKLTITQAGVVSSPVVSVRSVGLASKAFIVSGVIYYLSEYLSQYQPTYFLINGSTSTSASPIIAAKLAYENGNTVTISSSTLAYTPTALPSVTIIGGNICYVSYLFKDLIAAVNKGTALPSGTQTAGIYSQTGVNLGTFTIGTQDIDTAEIGNDLLISGGFLWMYDGYLPVEQNFFLFPDNVEASLLSNPGPTGNTNTTITLSSVSSVSGIVAGMNVTDSTHADIPANTTVLSVGTTTVVMSQAATGSHSGDTLKFTGNIGVGDYFYQVTYEWSDNQGNIYRSAPSIPTAKLTTDTSHTSIVLNIPTLRLTQKVPNPVKIVIYRYSTAQPIYYQVTSLTAPILNDTTIDSITYTDIASDASILGNNIIYTNGGVVENVNAPASNIFTLFDTRFWMLDSEDKNLWWFSKQVIESTPVEMSDLFTYYIAPTTGAQSSLGPITAGAPMDDKLISFHSSGIVYTNGNGPDNTGSNNQYSQPIFITSTVGTNNQSSIVLMPLGLMFQSVGKGIWLLDRNLQTSYIGAPVEAFNGSTVQSAVNIPTQNQVRFTLNTGQMLVYDYFYDQWSTFVGSPAISSCIYKNLHTTFNSLGVVSQETTGSYLDGTNPVLISLTTSWIALAGIQGYQSAFRFFLLGQYITPFKLLCSIAYDFDQAPLQTSLIAPTNYSQAYGGATPNPANGTDSQDPYGQGNPYGGPSSRLDWRIFLKKQRCSSFQITLQEVYDPSFGVVSGAGLTLSGINLIVGIRKGYRTISSAHSIGGGTK